MTDTRWNPARTKPHNFKQLKIMEHTSSYYFRAQFWDGETILMNKCSIFMLQWFPSFWNASHIVEAIARQPFHFIIFYWCHGFKWNCRFNVSTAGNFFFASSLIWILIIYPRYSVEYSSQRWSPLGILMRLTFNYLLFIWNMSSGRNCSCLWHSALASTQVYTTINSVSNTFNCNSALNIYTTLKYLQCIIYIVNVKDEEKKFNNRRKNKINEEMQISTDASTDNNANWFWIVEKFKSTFQCFNRAPIDFDSGQQLCSGCLNVRIICKTHEIFTRVWVCFRNHN